MLSGFIGLVRREKKPSPRQTERLLMWYSEKGQRCKRNGRQDNIFTFFTFILTVFEEFLSYFHIQMDRVEVEPFKYTNSIVICNPWTLAAFAGFFDLFISIFKHFFRKWFFARHRIDKKYCLVITYSIWTESPLNQGTTVFSFPFR